jgi:hypothetical protein
MIERDLQKLDLDSFHRLIRHTSIGMHVRKKQHGDYIEHLLNRASCQSSSPHFRDPPDGHFAGASFKACILVSQKNASSVTEMCNTSFKVHYNYLYEIVLFTNA